MIEIATNMIQAFLFLLVFVVVLVAAYMVSKWLGSYNKTINKGKNIHIIETVSISPQKILHIIKVGKKYFLIAVTKDNISYISELDESDIDVTNLDNNNMQHVSFRKMLDNKIEKYKRNSKKS